jgi:hypothetical protein
MKITAICRFDGTAILINNGESLFFESYEKLQKYCEEKEIKIEVQHFHPASGLRVQRNGG